MSDELLLALARRDLQKARQDVEVAELRLEQARRWQEVCEWNQKFGPRSGGAEPQELVEDER